MVECMELGPTAIAALEIFESPAQNNVGGGLSIFDHLNHCRTAHGKRLLKELLGHPLISIDELNERLDVVQVLVENGDARDRLHKQLLRQFPDVVLLGKKLEAGKAKLEDCFKLVKATHTADQIVETLDVQEQDHPVQCILLQPLRKIREDLNAFCTLIMTNVELDPVSKSYRISPSVSDELAEISTELAKLNSRAERVANQLGESLGTDAIKIECNTDMGYYFRVTLKSERDIRKADVRILETTKGGGVKFTNNRLDNINKEFLQVQSQYDESQQELTRCVLTQAAQDVHLLYSMANIVAKIDVFVSFAVASTSAVIPYTRPQLMPPGSAVFELRQCRHPIVEKTLVNSQYIPNDIVAEGEKSFFVLTGANMGGKSTFLRSAGLTVLLGQIGCFVPCESARFSLVDGIFTRIGAYDAQYQGKSTFMAEMCETAAILKDATYQSLILIDELGRGTTTFDGFGLAWSIADQIIRIVNCTCIFASHFHEIGALRTLHPDNVKLLRVEVHEDEEGKVTLLYQFSPGVAEKSYGISVAKMEASQLLNKLEDDESQVSARRQLMALNNLNIEQVRLALADD